MTGKQYLTQGAVLTELQGEIPGFGLSNRRRNTRLRCEGQDNKQTSETPRTIGIIGVQYQQGTQFNGADLEMEQHEDRLLLSEG